MPAPLTTLSSTWDLVAGPYTQNVAPHFETFAEFALDDAAVEAGNDVADVACGPGTLALKAVARGAKVKALDFSPGMVEELKKKSSTMTSRDLDVVVGDGQALPWPDKSFDAAFSMFGLMFFPDRDKGFRELLRVLRPGGRAVVSSWVEISEVPLLNDALTTLMQAASAISGEPVQPPPPRPGLSVADDYTREMGGAGFADVNVEQRSVLVPFASPTALLEWMTGSMAPVVLMKKSWGDARFAEVFLRWKVSMMEKHGALPVELPLVALMGIGRRP